MHNPITHAPHTTMIEVLWVSGAGLALVLALAACGAIGAEPSNAAVGQPSTDGGRADGNANDDATASNYRVACHILTGVGACANAGKSDLGGGCATNITGLGDKTAWHFLPAPNGSWDWNCDGSVSQLYSVSTYVCQELMDQASCDNAPAGSYLLNAADCGAHAPIQDMACQWAGTFCMPRFQETTSVNQGCR